jgi:hypothetical protein
MAIFRMLGNSGPLSNSTVSEKLQAAAITSADAKQFGFENVCIFSPAPNMF